MMSASGNRISRGFTIVELLIVVIVIAILATITIIGFNGIQQRARTSAVQNQVSQAVRQIETAKVSSGTGQYPANQAAADLKVSSGLTVNYYYQPTSNTYCVDAQTNTIIYSSSGAGTQMVNRGCTDAGIIGSWSLNNNTLDSSGNSFNGSSSGVSATTGQNGAVGNALFFSGTPGSSVVTSASNTLSPTSLTISAWVRPTAWTSVTASSIVSKRTGTNGIFFFYWNAVQAIALDHGTDSRWNTGYSPPLDQWTHLLITSVTGERIFYVNGTEYARSTISVGPAVNTSGALTIGSEPGAAAYNFHGSLDDIRMYNRVLGAAEVASLYAQGAQ